ncbi:EamA family transporter [Leifsonia sp. RAF41]|uniref:EamA family transporter n=1 Tax=Leifsonia sp. RAF41 TaxID=3233056 RepID=UPI003F99F271
MTGTVLAILAALAFGVGDFAAGVASRRIHFLFVTLVIEALGVLLVCAALLLTGPPPPAISSLAWGAASGIGSAIGTLALYRGLSRGQMSVAAPLSAVGAAAIPVVVGFLLGDRLSAVAIAGVILAFPGIWLVAKPTAKTTREGTTDGLVAGMGFAVLFVALHQAGDTLWPVAAGQITAVAIVAIATALYRPPLPARLDLLHNRGWVLAAAVLSIGATIAYFYASHLGLLTIAAVLASIYPAFTIVLAVMLLHERPSRAQLAGLIACGVAVTAITVA